MLSTSNAANPKNAHTGTGVAQVGVRRVGNEPEYGIVMVINNQVLKLVTLKKNKLRFK